jgi:hypothetical protein
MSGKANNVTISASGANVVVADSGAPLTAGSSCTADNANQLACPNVTRISAELGDGDDQFRNTTAIPGNVPGGAGNDIVDCGGGRDVARVDKVDKVKRCERLIGKR